MVGKHESPALFNDQDVMGHFDQSRIPPRVDFRVPQARLAFEKGIPDVLKRESGEPPAPIQVLRPTPNTGTWLGPSALWRLSANPRTSTREDYAPRPRRRGAAYGLQFYEHPDGTSMWD